MIKIIVKKKGRTLTEKLLEDQPIIVGSDSKCDIRLPSKSVSAEHAVISTLGGRVLIEDQNSEGGTYRNDDKISSEFLEVGDILRIGSYTLEIHDTEAKGISYDKTEFYTEEDLKDNGSLEVSDNKAIRDFLDAPPGPDTESFDDTGDDIPDTESFVGKPGGNFEISRDKTRKLANEEVSLPRIKTSSDLNKFLDKKLGEEPKTGKKELPGADGHTIAVPFMPDPRLYPLNIQMEHKFIPLESDEISIGRSEDADITVDHASVSSNHAVIQKRDNIISIIDQNSTNGTKVNGEPVYEKALICHDIIQLGDVKFEFLEGAVEPIGEQRAFESFKGDRSEVYPGFSPSVERSVRKNESKRPMLYLGALVVIACIAVLYIFVSPNPKKESYITPEEADKKLTQADVERNKIILHNLEQSKKLIKLKRFYEAREILTLIVERVDPGNMEAQKLIANIDDIEEAQKQQEEENKLRLEDRKEQIGMLMAQGKKAMSSNDFATAKVAFGKILKLDENNKAAKRYLEESSALHERMIKEKKILSQKLSEIEQYYFQGVSFYEEGNFDSAADVLRKVVEFRSSPYYQGASGILSEIEARQLMDIEDQLSEVNALIKSEEILKAENILKSILKRYPRSKEAKRIYARVHKEILVKAQKIYGEGLVYEQVVEDNKSAVESYEEVLRLLPDPNEEYHQKAKIRLRKLK